MDILNTKHIPLKIFITRKKEKKAIKFAWHLKWSITWRWIAEWKLCRTVWGVKRFRNPSNSHGWVHICMGRIGLIAITYQPNMKRD